MQRDVRSVCGKARRAFVGLAIGLTLLVATGTPAGAGTLAVTATLATPHLRNAKLADIRIDSSSGRRLLRYTTKIINVGAGGFELQGTRSSTTSPWTVQQRLYNTDGTVNATVTTNATLFYAGDGHNHWHVRDLELGQLNRRDNGVKVGTSAKRGFCFFDNYRYNSSRPAAYTSSNVHLTVPWMLGPDAADSRAGVSTRMDMHVTSGVAAVGHGQLTEPMPAGLPWRSHT